MAWFAALIAFFAQCITFNIFLLRYPWTSRHSERASYPCNIETAQRLEPGSTVVIGHAYGRPGTESSNIDPRVEGFLDRNKSNISRLILTGDVFNRPVSASWERLDAKYSGDFEINIAPGNHDTGLGRESRLRVLFKQSKFYPAEGYPVLLNDNEKNHLYLLEDSTEGYLFNENIIPSEDAVGADMVIVFRHNIAFNEQREFANSLAGMPDKLPRLSDSQLSSKYLIVSGDSGAFEHLPRTTCLQSASGMMAVTSGVGGLESDVALVIKKEGINQIKLE